MISRNAGAIKPDGPSAKVVEVDCGSWMIPEVSPVKTWAISLEYSPNSQTRLPNVKIPPIYDALLQFASTSNYPC